MAHGAAMQAYGAREGHRTIPGNGSLSMGVDFPGRFVTKRVRGRGAPADGIRTSSEDLM